MSDRFDCFALATHHTPKGSTGARGAGASFNAADLVIEIFRKGEEAVRSVECMKNKDGPEGKWGSFTLQTVTVGYDAKGRPKTTCLVSMGGFVDEKDNDNCAVPMTGAQLMRLSVEMGDYGFNLTHKGKLWIGTLIASIMGISLGEQDGKQQIAQIQKKLEGGGWLERDNRPDGHGHVRDCIVASAKLKAMGLTKTL